jgi:nitrate/nitrite transporter NarK
LIAAAGLSGLISQPRSIALSVVFFTMTCIVFAYLPTIWAIPTEILTRSSAAASVGLINAVGSAAGFAGPYLFGYLNTRTGSFSSGLTLMMLTAIAAALLILRIPGSVPAANN